MLKKANLLRYYWRSFRDENLQSFKLGEGVGVGFEELKKGQLSIKAMEKVNQLAQLLEGEKEYHVCPIVLQHEQDSYNRILPLFIPAKINDGKLMPIPHRPPYIARDHLEPNSKNKPTIGTVDQVDKYTQMHPYSGECDWNTTWNYAESLFKEITGKTIGTFQEKHYKRNERSWIFPIKEKNISKSMLALYQDLLSKKRFPLLLQNYLSLDEQVKVPLLSRAMYMDRHLGQMNGSFPLSEGQRESLQHLLSIEHGEILAVNGPPGTGKTTLIQNIVASLWVEAAVQQQEPPIIVTASTNNQAVKNVLDSFEKEVWENKTKETNWTKKIKKLQGRWIEGLKSYGLFFPSSEEMNKLSQNGHNYQVVRWNAEHFMDDLENICQSNKFTTLKKKFVEHYNRYAGESVNSVWEVKERIYGELCSTYQDILDALSLAKKLERSADLLRKRFAGSDEVLSSSRREWEEELEIRRDSVEEAEKLMQICKNHRVNEPRIWKLYGLFSTSYVERKREERNQTFLRVIKKQLPFRITSLSMAEIMNKIESHYGQLTDEYKRINDQLVQAEALIQDLYEGKKEYKRWCERFGIEYNDDQPDFRRVLQDLDTTLRYQAFLLATHYWEAKWLEEMEDKRKYKVRTEKPLSAVEQKMVSYRRFAKLTPCFVFTLHMLPQILQVNQGYLQSNQRKQENETAWLYECIDLLILDEAGQIAPHIAAPAFAFAKKALVIGDTLQLEPITNLTPSVDLGNLKAFKVIQRFDQQKDIEETGATVAKGNVMKIAQRRCKYQKNELAGGLFLAEHRRCVDEIIEYCNLLAYNGKLIPSRRPYEKNYEMLPHMGYANIEGELEKKGKSKFNVIEAEAIVVWLDKNKKIILDRANRGKKHKRELKDVIGIVTPFKFQETLIRAYLKEFDMDDITVGTLHALQGAERDIILFSATDTPTRSEAFYDKGVNMLNVAVSRAKDSFIIFANWNQFGKVKGTPSHFLRKYIEESNENDTKVWEQKKEEWTGELFGKMAIKRTMKSEDWDKGEHQIIQQIVHVYENKGQIILNRDSGNLTVTQNVTNISREG